LHRGETEATSAEQLMRARFSAFAVRDEPFLLRSWDPSTRPRRIAFDPLQHWVRLDIVATTAGRLFDSEGTVEFLAHHRREDRAGVLRERSRFVREGRRWVYAGPISDPFP